MEVAPPGWDWISGHILPLPEPSYITQHTPARLFLADKDTPDNLDATCCLHVTDPGSTATIRIAKTTGMHHVAG